MDINKLKNPRGSGHFRVEDFQKKLSQAIRQGGLTHLRDNQAGITRVLKEKERTIRRRQFGARQQKNIWLELERLEKESGVVISSADKKDIRKIFQALGDNKKNDSTKKPAPHSPAAPRRLNRDNTVNIGRLNRLDITNRAKRLEDENHDNHGFGGRNRVVRPGEADGRRIIKPGQKLGDGQVNPPKTAGPAPEKKTPVLRPNNFLRP